MNSGYMTVLIRCPECDEEMPIEVDIDPDVGACFDLPTSHDCHRATEDHYTNDDLAVMRERVEEAVQNKMEELERDFNDMADHPDSPR